MTDAPTIFTATSAFSLATLFGTGVVAYYASDALLPKNVKKQDRYTFIWLVSMNQSVHSQETFTTNVYGFQTFNALVRFTFEGSFLWFSTFGRQVNTSSGALAGMCTFPSLLFVIARKLIN
jgi:hypothetical protein